MVDRSTLRFSAVLLVAGLLLSLVVGQLHPARENPNDHPAVFAEYSADAAWTPVHLGQFVGIAVVIAGILALYFAVKFPPGAILLAARLGAVSAVAALALYGVLQAVDGVALKRAVDAWSLAPEAEKASRFAGAETIRWLEEAVRSYHDFTLGLALILIGGAVAASVRTLRPVGFLMALSGLGYVVQGWVLGAEGFSPNHGLAQLPTYLFTLAWIIWLAVSAWRMKSPVRAPA